MCFLSRPPKVTPKIRETQAPLAHCLTKKGLLYGNKMQQVEDVVQFWLWPTCLEEFITEAAPIVKELKEVNYNATIKAAHFKQVLDLWQLDKLKKKYIPSLHFPPAVLHCFAAQSWARGDILNVMLHPKSSQEPENAGVASCWYLDVFCIQQEHLSNDEPCFRQIRASWRMTRVTSTWSNMIRPNQVPIIT